MLPLHSLLTREPGLPLEESQDPLAEYIVESVPSFQFASFLDIPGTVIFICPKHASLFPKGLTTDDVLVSSTSAVESPLISSVTAAAALYRLVCIPLSAVV